MVYCPCCGNPYAGKYVPPEWLHLAVYGATAQLILKAMLRNVGIYMRADDIADLVYSHAHIGGTASSVRVCINTMRARLDRAGWAIEGLNQVGYRLLPKQETGK